MSQSSQPQSTTAPPGPGRPPTFAEAKNRRQKVRAAGLDPNYWYPVLQSRELGRGEVKEVVFWRRSYALYRGDDGKVAAVENRCAHRQLKLSVGHVKGCNVVCPYHGWEYDREGHLAHVPHDLFGKKMPNIKLGHQPVVERYGLVWVFFGDPARAGERAIPTIPELEGADAWGHVIADFEWRAHHSMIIDNVSDFTHAYLHRKFRPFEDATLKKLETVGDRVYVSYDTKVGRGPISGLFVDRDKVNTNAMDLCYEYPYQWSNTDDKIKHYCFVLPIDEQTTRAFFLFYFKAFKVPGLPIGLPRWAMDPLLRIAKHTLVGPLLQEDGDAVEAEQEGYNEHWQAPIAELNPAVHEFQALTIRKWEEYLASVSERELVKLEARRA
ncbi:MAG: aromatic ring-hydroxylating dioxygenase subunit alpha [Myxococcales bacterium]|nr:aromatic ring-hydroxylating dioxygenase subunit alpha [Myxococcales bacterium]